MKKISSISKNHKKNCPIICVGNIYVGGTGKTPLAAEIFKFIKSTGKNPSFIKKHYNYLKDEIEMLKEIGDTHCDKNRITAIDKSLFNGNNVVILDDGFQDFSIKPDFSILCFNSKQLVGNGFTIPSGPLREPLKAVKRADCIVINGDRTKETLEFENKIKKILIGKQLPFFYSKYKIKDIEKLRNKEITAFAGIGNPSNFFDLLKENKLNVKKTFSFPDHHNYSEEDLNNIISNKSTNIVTTKKDYFRMTDKQKDVCDFVEINLEIENKNKLENLIKNYL
tara:strand:- start:1 stop:843 length:843 start_codon:yes stop_codon:yes gene_type:complete